MSLTTLPDEVLNDIAFALVASSPLGPPTDLIPLLCTSKHLNRALHFKKSTGLYARIARLKFDCNAVKRRAFKPYAKDCAEQLVHACLCIQFFRRGNVDDDDVVDHLPTAFMLMLENDGKNRAQLEWAGIESFLDQFVRRRLYDNRMTNDGWPLETPHSSSALWLTWMFATKEKITSQSPYQQTQLYRIVSAFALVPFRYASAYAPPTHFDLPLSASNPDQQHELFTPTPHGSYPLYQQGAPANQVHFRSRPDFAVGPISIPAKLLFVAQQESHPFYAPHVPLDRADADQQGRIGPTAEDLREVNTHQGAKYVRQVNWDWNAGVARYLDNGKVAPEDASSMWDCDWWRARQCGDLWQPMPRWRVGTVYVPGSLSGLWQGRWELTSEESHARLLASPAYPPAFSGQTLYAIAQPMFMRLTEHHYVAPPTISTSNPNAPSSIQRLAGPIPTPKAEPAIILTDTGDHEEVPLDMSMQNAWIPGREGGVSWEANGLNSGLRDGWGRDRFQATPEDVQERETITFRLDYDQRGAGYVYETWDRTKKGVHDLYDVFGQSAASAAAASASSSSNASVHEPPSCARCKKRAALLARMRKGDSEVVEKIFERVGLGMSTVGKQCSKPSANDEDEDDEDDDDEIDLDTVWELDGFNVDPPSSSCSTDCGQSSQSECSADSEDEDDTEMEPELRGQPRARNPYTGQVYEATRNIADKEYLRPCDGVEDVLLTGEVDEKHAQAWNKYTFYGRVRPWDGLVGILRSAGNPINHLFFYGYLVGGETLVGNWRLASTDPFVPTWESAFVLSKREE